MDPKSILLSKTLWANLIALGAALLGAHKIVVDPDTQATLVAAIMAVLNIGMRAVTKGPVNLTGAAPAVALFVTAGLGIGACSAPQIADTVAKLQAIEVQAKADANTFCLARGKVLPFVKAGESVAAILVPEVAGLVVLDQTMVSPALTAACKAVDPTATVVAPAKS